MKKPEGYDQATAQGEFTPVELGGHYAVIKQVTERESSTGKEMIVVVFDFAPEDTQAGYFSTSFKNNTREDKKWPFNGTKYIMVMDYNDPNKTSRAFKTFCSCTEKSNNFEIKWGVSNWAKQFAGKKIGVVFGEEENEYEGRITMRRVPKWFCKWDAVQDASIPAPKFISGDRRAAAKTSNSFASDNDGFMVLPDEADEEIPF